LKWVKKFIHFILYKDVVRDPSGCFSKVYGLDHNAVVYAGRGSV